MDRIVRRGQTGGRLEPDVFLRLRRTFGEVGDGSRAGRVRGQEDAQQRHHRPCHVAQTRQGGGSDGAESKETATTWHRRPMEAEIS